MSEDPELSIFEGKVFGFDKPKIKIYLISFRLDEENIIRNCKFVYDSRNIF